MWCDVVYGVWCGDGVVGCSVVMGWCGAMWWDAMSNQRHHNQLFSDVKQKMQGW
jgi:hypothetical protein